MDFDTFLDQGWTDHGAKAADVFARLPEGIALVTTAAQAGSLGHLATHVAGEHLGKWDEGLAFLARLTELPVFDAQSVHGKLIYRNLSILSFCAGNKADGERYEELARIGGATPPQSDKIRVLCGIATALAGQHRIIEASRAFHNAIRLANYDMAADDPAARALAVSGNNLAASLEEHPQRDNEEITLMKLAALTARRFWEVAGTWLEVERAEYRLAMTMVAAGDPVSALGHAETCLDICEDNRAVPFEHFFAHEAHAWAHLAKKDVVSARMSRDRAAALIPTMKEDVQPYCRETLAKLDGKLGIG